MSEIQDQDDGHESYIDENDNINEEQIERPVLQVGSILREARERKKLSLEKVAERLCMNTSRIDAIENDDYSKIRVKAYALGYLRSYAKFLEIPVRSLQDLVDAFHQLPFWEEEHQTVQIKPSKSMITFERNSSHHSIKWFGVGIGVMIIILMGYWWKGGAHNKDSEIKSVTIDSPVPVQASTEQPKLLTSESSLVEQKEQVKEEAAVEPARLPTNDHKSRADKPDKQTHNG